MTILFWVLSVILFTMPILAYLIKQPRTNLNKSPHILQPPNISLENKSKIGITIHVSGALHSPGVYDVKIGTKIHELLDQLDLKQHASIDHLNLAKTLRDGQKIVIKKIKLVDHMININLATSSELKTLRGIGPSSARKIIDHRESHGAFKSINDLLNIDGISKKKLNNIRRFVCI